ncbi:hypothetical protein L1887_19602 [Cichorium endivia]|nr:hypothetical protein L1887_19602 [Cichorium endivia]
MSSSFYDKQFADLRIPLEEILSATNNFSSANFIRKDGFGSAYKGQLLLSGQLIDIVARRLDPDSKQGNKEFWSEVSMLSTLNHENLVSIIGFCDEGHKKIIIYTHESHGSLDEYLSDPTLTWMQRLLICVGVARALRYIHYDKGRDFSIIHRNIKSSKILLDENWKPKLFGFQLSMKNTAAKRHQLILDDLSGTIGYIDPRYEKTGGVTYKSDVYSFGVVLFEVLCGRRAFIIPESCSAESAKQHSEEESHDNVGKLDEIVDHDGRSLQLVKQHSTEGSLPDVVKVDEIFEKEGCSSQLVKQQSDNTNPDTMVKLGDIVDPHQTNEDSAKQHSEEESQDDVGKFDEIVEHEGLSLQLVKQHSTEGSLPDVVKVDEIFEKEGCSSQSVKQQSDNRNPDTMVKLCDIVDPHQTNEKDLPSPPSFSNIPSRPPLSIRDVTALMGPPSLGNVPASMMQPPSIGSIETWKISQPAEGSSFSGYALPPSRTNISDISMEQRVVVGTLDMCTFIPRRHNRHLHIPDGELLAPLAILHYEESKLDDMINPHLWKQMDPESFKIFSETAYYCLKEQRSQRPEIDQIVVRLEKALDLQQRHQNHLTLKEHSDVAAEVKGPSTNRLEWENLKHLKIGFHDIELATENFSPRHCIGSGAFGKVYRAQLHLDSQNSSECDLIKISSTVAIKCIFKREDTQDEEGFCAEIKTLSSCKHPNVVSLLGFCDEESQMILVYEYASRGSLDDYLRGTNTMINLKWVQRLQMCLDIAQGLDYLHNKQGIIHRDIKSDNILLDDKWVAKIADFGLSKIGPVSQQVSYLETNVAGTLVYLDPEYMKTRKLKKASDVYSFGVVLFEIMSGTLAYDPIYMKENDMGLAPFARQHFHRGTLKDMLDPKLKEEFDENIFTLSKGPNQDSLYTFMRIAYQCLAETQTERPKIGTVIKELKKALYLQEHHKDNFMISLEDIRLATGNFNENNFVAKGGFGSIYKGKVKNAYGRHTTIAAKRFDAESEQGEHELLTELEILWEHKHENIIGFVGYCKEMHESIIVYEYASKGSLERYVTDNGLTWMKRLRICIDIVSGLDFLHEHMVIHRDIKSANILLNDDWKAKISDFGLAVIVYIDNDMDFVIEPAAGTFGYLDPLYYRTGILTRESDIYSLGVVLFEMLCGRLAYQEGSGFLGPLAANACEEGKVDDIVFKGIKKHVAPKSLTTFQSIALQCLHPNREERPTTGEVLRRLKQALEFQEDYEIWEPKLPNDYKKIIPEIYSSKREKDLYDLLTKGILLQDDEVFFSLGSNGEKNEMISAKRLSYIKRCPHTWRSIPESRFQLVAEMLDILNLNIKIKTRPQLLSQDFVYGIYLVFKFSNPRKVLSKSLYVNLKYRNGSKTSHAYFATQRDNHWMMIELCRFLNNKTDTVYKFLLESFSRYYCGDNTVYVEGIEFRAIDNVKHEDIRELKEVQQVLRLDSNMDLLQKLPTNSGEILKRPEHDADGEKLFLLSEVNGKKHLMLSAKAALYGHPNVKLFKTKPSVQSRFPEGIELLRQQVFRINCTIKSQMLSQDTDYACYLVFKLSEKCRGLHCPVKVRDLLHRNNKEVEILYFRSPSTSNLHDTHQAPEQRPDGWMEVKVWKFNFNHEVKTNRVRMNLKLISYEGTMSGLIVCGIEFRPM